MNNFLDLFINRVIQFLNDELLTIGIIKMGLFK